MDKQSIMQQENILPKVGSSLRDIRCLLEL
jgi:hypothetical protein